MSRGKVYSALLLILLGLNTASGLARIGGFIYQFRGREYRGTRRALEKFQERERNGSRSNGGHAKAEL